MTALNKDKNPYVFNMQNNTDRAAHKLESMSLEKRLPQLL